MTIEEFQAEVGTQGAALFRTMPWREPEPDGHFDPYKILVSECMLQQTQVPRVVPKFEDFLRLFPTISALASAELSSVIKAWSGLGYNRRALYVHEAAQKLAPLKHWTYDDLVSCRGVGPNTARALLVYAYNEPHIFIETNIRTVIIHYFFADEELVSDAPIQEILQQAIDHQQPRRWYWALMDMGAAIKASHGNAARRSVVYKKQSPFKGSLRQVRGQVLKLLATAPLTLDQMSTEVTDDRLSEVVASLRVEGLIHEHDGLLHLGRQ